MAENQVSTVLQDYDFCYVIFFKDNSKFFLRTSPSQFVDLIGTEDLQGVWGKIEKFMGIFKFQLAEHPVSVLKKAVTLLPQKPCSQYDVFM